MENTFYGLFCICTSFSIMMYIFWEDLRKIFNLMKSQNLDDCKEEVCKKMKDN